MNVLVRISYQQIFYREGFVRAGRSILLPDSLNGGIRAGFHWDYANPPGVDTIRVFASTNLKLTNRIRQSVGSSGQSGLNQGVIVGKPMAQLVSLRQELIGGMARGLITVSDEPMVERSPMRMPRLPKDRILRMPIRNMLMAAPFQMENKTWGTILEQLMSLKLLIPFEPCLFNSQSQIGRQLPSPSSSNHKDFGKQEEGHPEIGWPSTFYSLLRLP